MKRIFILFLTVLILLSCLSCKSSNIPNPGNSLIEYTAWRRDILGTPFLTSEEAVEDFDYMWDTLDENATFLLLLDKNAQYAGINSVELDALKAEARAKLQSQTTIKLLDFYTTLSESLSALSQMGHLAILSPDIYDTLCTKFNGITDDITDSTDFYNRYGELCSNQKSKEAYEYLGSVTSSSYYDDMELSDALELVNTYNTYKYWLDGKLMYIQIKSFFFPYTECDNAAIELLRSFLSEAASNDVEHIVIDIQGNGGGSSYIWLQGIVTPLLKEDVIVRDLRASLFGNVSRYLRTDEFETQNEDIAVNDIYESISAQTAQQLKVSFYSQAKYQPDLLNINYDGKLWVLIDNSVVSASSEFASFCKATDFATLVGERTSGRDKSSQPIAFPLKHSGLVVFFEDIIGFNDDGTCNAYVGTAPHIQNREGMSALETCLHEIKENG